MFFEYFPKSISTYGADVDGVIRSIYNIVMPWFILAQALFFFFIFTSRRKAGKKSSYIPADNFKTLLWVIIPVIIVFCFDISIEHMQSPVWEKIKINLPENPGMKVGVEGQQFKWNFTHPGRDKVLGTDDDVVEQSHLYVLVNQDVVFELTSKDVLHSFWLPNLRLKQDAVPGRNIKGWFNATEKGVYPIACAELCGVGHGDMMAWLHVVDQAELDAWYAEKEATKDAW